MRKSHLIAVTAVLLVVAACGWAWWDRDRVAPKLINPLLQGSHIDKLRGLELGLGRVSVEHLELTTDAGARLQLDHVQLLYPSSLLFASERNRAQLAIAKLGYLSLNSRQPESSEPAGTTDPAAPEIKLSNLLSSLQKYLPEKIQVGELNWGDEVTHSGRLNLRRDYDNHTIHAELSSGRQQLSLQIQPQDNRVQVTAQLGEERQKPALSLSGTLERTETGHWHANAQLKSELRRVTGLPLSASLHEIAASASGNISTGLEARLPDKFLQLQDYTDVSVKLQGDSVRLTLPETLLGAAAEVTLSTRSPVAIQFSALQPLRPEQISGSGTLALTPENQQRPLIQAEFDTSTTQGRPSLTTVGNVNLESATPLLQVPQWRRMLKNLSVDSATGKIEFRGTAKLRPLAQPGGTDLGRLSDISLSLLPDSQASVTIAAGVAKDGWPAQFGWRRGKVSVQLPKPVTIGTDRWPGNIRIAGEAVNLGAAEDSGAPSLNSQLHDIDCEIAQKIQCTLALTANAPQFAHEARNLTVHKPNINTRVKLLLDGDRQQWKFQQLAFSAERISAKAVEFELLTFESPLLECTLTEGTPDCASAELTNRFSTLEIAELTASGSLTLSELRFKQENKQPLLSAKYRSDNLRLQASNGYKLNGELSGQIALNRDALSGESEIRASKVRLQSRWKHNLESNRGRADITLAETTFSQGQPLSQSVEGLPVDIVAGTVSAKGQVSWPLARQDAIHMRFDEVAAVYGESFAVGASGRLSLLRQGDHWVTGEPQAIQLDTLDLGVPVQNIRFSLALDQNQDLTLGNVTAELLGGKLQSPKLAWSLAGEERRSHVSLSEISLRELAKEMDADNFAASGILDLQIPLVTGAEGVTVNKGEVKSRPPGGRLRYYGAFSAEMLTGNPQLKLLAGALEDYSYRELSGTLDYPPSGDMQLQLKLVGRSASVAADRDLIINLNLENNIPDMLRSLQASRDLTEALEKQIQ